MKPSRVKPAEKRILHDEHALERAPGVTVEHEEHDNRDTVRISIWDRALEDAFVRLAPAQARALAASLIQVADKVEALYPSNVVPMTARRAG